MPPEQLRHHTVLTCTPRSLPTGHAYQAPVCCPYRRHRAAFPGTHARYVPFRACCTLQANTFLFRHHTFLVPEHAVLLGLTAEMSPSYVSVT